MNKINRYTRIEDEIILHVFPMSGYEGVAKALPKRTMDSIRSRVKDLRRKGHVMVNPVNGQYKGAKPKEPSETQRRRRPLSMSGLSRHERYMMGEVRA